jgi:hypothetical protein
MINYLKNKIYNASSTISFIIRNMKGYMNEKKDEFATEVPNINNIIKNANRNNMQLLFGGSHPLSKLLINNQEFEVNDTDIFIYPPENEDMNKNTTSLMESLKFCLNNHNIDIFNSQVIIKENINKLGSNKVYLESINNTLIELPISIKYTRYYNNKGILSEEIEEIDDTILGTINMLCDNKKIQYIICSNNNNKYKSLDNWYFKVSDLPVCIKCDKSGELKYCIDPLVSYADMNELIINNKFPKNKKPLHKERVLKYIEKGMLF